MKTLKIAFEGFWVSFDKKRNFIVDILSKNYNVEVIEPKTSSDKKQVQYLFFSCFSDHYLDYDCVRIFFTGENITPDFNVCDYAIGFDYIDLEDRYFRYPLAYAMYKSDVDKMLQKSSMVNDSMCKRKFCSMVVSNVKYAETKRKEFFDLLSQYRKVDSGGKYLNNINKPDGVEDKEAFQKEYKFSIAFENSSHPGYCTEKIVQGFAAQTIPIYWGDQTIAEQFNEKAFINCHNFNSFEDVVNEIKRIDEDDSLYLSMLREQPISYEKVNLIIQNFENWLFHIIDQKYEDSFRRNLYGRCVYYQEDLKNYRRLREEEVIRNKKLIVRINRKIKRIIKII